MVLRLPVKVRSRFGVILDSKDRQIKLEGMIWASGIPQCKGLFWRKNLAKHLANNLAKQGFHFAANGIGPGRGVHRDIIPTKTLAFFDRANDFDLVRQA